MINKYLDQTIKEEIAKITGFDIKKIILLLSKHENENSIDFDYHEFSYDNKKYAFNNGKIIKLK